MNMKKKDTSNVSSLTFFEPLKEESVLKRSNVLQSILGFLSTKKEAENSEESDQAKDTKLMTSTKSEHLKKIDGSVSAGNKHDAVNKLMQPGSSTSLKDDAMSRPDVLRIPSPFERKQTLQGSEVEVHLRNISTIFTKMLVRNNPQLKASREDFQVQTSEADIRQYWMPDKHSHECYECGDRFTTFRRRHHCRICGHIFCSRCCYQLISGQIIGYAGMVRSCTYCYSLITSASKNPSGRNSACAVNTEQDGAGEVTSSSDIYALGGTMPLDQVNSSASKQHSRVSRSRSQLSMRGSPVEEQSCLLAVTSPLPYEAGNWTSVYDMFDVTAGVTSNLENAYENDQKLLAQDSIQLHELWERIIDVKDGVEFRDHRFRLRKFSQSIIGNELVDWLISHGIASERDQACAIGQALVDAEWIKNAMEDRDSSFRDEYCVYQYGQSAFQHKSRKPYFEVAADTIEFQKSQKPSFRPKVLFNEDFSLSNEPTWVKEISAEEDSLPMVEDDSIFWSTNTNAPTKIRPQNAMLNVSEDEVCSSPLSVMSVSSYIEIDSDHNTIKYKRASANLEEPRRENAEFLKPRFLDDSLTEISADYIRSYLGWNATLLNNSACSRGWRENDLYMPSIASSTKQIYLRLRNIFFTHWMRFLRQLLQSQHLDMAWSDVIVPLAKRVSETVIPNCEVNMDICHYVHIKKLLDGSREESYLVNGIVFSNNVVNKHMKTYIENPAIMLLATPLEYQRVQYKLASLDPVVRQESEFLKHLVSRITSRKPDLIISQCSVSHEARRLLLDAGITLIINVKQSVMERISRCTSADIACSIDQLQNFHLGSCARFHVRHHYNGRRKFCCSDGILSQSTRLNDDSVTTQSYKTLIYLEGCNMMHGCTLLLRGLPDCTAKNYCADAVTRDCLSKVKNILLLLIRIMYHGKLEMSYLMDHQELVTLCSAAFPKPITGSLSHCTPETNKIEMETFLTDDSIDFKGNSSSNICKEKASDTIMNLHVSNSVVYESNTETSYDKTQNRISSLPFKSEMSSKMDNVINDSVEEATSHQDLNNKSDVFLDRFSSTLLSVSPIILPTIPYLLTTPGKSSPLLIYLTSPLFSSNLCKNDLDTNIIAGNGKRQSHQRTVINESKSLAYDKGISSAKNGTIPSKTFVLQQNMWRTPQHIQINDLNSSSLNETASALAMDKENEHENCMRNSYQRQESLYSMCSSGYSRLTSQPSVKSMKGVDDWLSSDERTTMYEVLRQQDAAKMNFSHPSSDAILSNTFEEVKTSNLPHFEYDGRLDNTNNEKTAWRPHRHPFITVPLTKSADSRDISDLLADYRATGSSLIPINPRPSWDKLLFLFSRQSLCSEKDSLIDNEEECDNLVDCFAPENHQHIFVLFSSYSLQSPNAPYPCVMPWAVNIDYYHGNDITLGGFLERYCFRPNYHCPSPTCERPMVEHIRSFVHGSTCMNIVLKELSKPVSVPNIFSWCWNPENKTSTDLKTLSDDAWSMSFAKFLELRLQTYNSPSCTASPSSCNDIDIPPFTSFQYFLFRDIVASFKCFEIDIYDIALPPCEIKFDATVDWRRRSSSSTEITADEHTSQEYKQYVHTMNKLSKIGYEALDSIIDMVKSAHSSNPYDYQSGSDQLDCDEDTLCSLRDAHFEKLKSLYQEERCHLRDCVDGIHIMLQSVRHRPFEHKKVLNGGISSTSCDSISNVESPLSSTAADLNKNSDNFDDADSSFVLDEVTKSEVSMSLLKLACLICEMVYTWNARINSVADQDKTYRKGSKVVGLSYTNEQPVALSTSSSFKEKSLFVKSSPNLETLHEEFNTAGPYTTDSKDVQKKGNTYLEDDQQQDNVSFCLSDLFDPESSEHSDESENFGSKGTKDTSGSIPPRFLDRQSGIVAASKRFSRTSSSISVKSFLSTHWRTNLTHLQVQSPFPPDEHYLLPHCVSSQVVVRDCEPSSMIAYTLCTPEYMEYIATNDQTSTHQIPKESASEENDIPSKVQINSVAQDYKFAESSSRSDSVKGELPSSQQQLFSEPSPHSLLSPSAVITSQHIEVQFKDSTTKFYCKVYYAAGFHALREKILDISNKVYVNSLARCARWAARGGKSGSAFHKTLDDRLILKQMSRFELESFLELAHSYLHYISEASNRKSPTTLSKILGVYRVSFHNSTTNRSFKQDLLVMENLFYKRNIIQVFDLKGSVRNRHVKTNVDSSTSATTPAPHALSSNSKSINSDNSLFNHNEVVLLDENLLSIMKDHPLYVHEHAKIFIQKALCDDARFLSSHRIIDYSLLVGIDGDKKEMVVGIIDYMRTFTWDKKLEMVVKSYGMLGRQGTRSMPTVVSPELYRTRFCEAMERYFQVVPDRWYGMHSYL